MCLFLCNIHAIVCNSVNLKQLTIPSGKQRENGFPFLSAAAITNNSEYLLCSTIIKRDFRPGNNVCTEQLLRKKNHTVRLMLSARDLGALLSYR